MYVLKKYAKFGKKSQGNFSVFKILVYVRTQKIRKIREKNLGEFLSVQNSRICTCSKNTQNSGKKVRGISHCSKFSYMYVLKKYAKFGKKSQGNFSLFKILVYVRAATVYSTRAFNIYGSKSVLRLVPRRRPECIGVCHIWNPHLMEFHINFQMDF